MLVEDDDALRFIVTDYLEHKSCQVDTAENGEQALKLYKENVYNLVILDVMLPKIDGFKVAEQIRKSDEQIPIIFLTARSMTEDKIAGLTIGGDDYITKPFNLEELLLKIKIFLKRSNSTINGQQEESTEKIGKFIFIPDQLSLSFEENIKKLTIKETELIKLFVQNKNRVLSRKEILETIWGSNDYFLGRSLDVFISRLRKYFKADPDIKIINIHGIGFSFSVKK